MMDVETSYSDFINCDRTGRRNAVPDISGEGSGAASTSELTKDLAEMDLKAAGQ
ncbi:cAMP-dependent protein kinase inhibitor gamma [Nematolebias whitei]|uniref:cAMP-dependent protein kinase inhibitor gamma n=1 Tax=Nematolebias whitei TaxID=451745 RepID=UPI0018972497|nr:cAMP-dependent protein kinase inhibitor gamma [Nematolebias whitei]